MLEDFIGKTVTQIDPIVRVDLEQHGLATRVGNTLLVAVGSYDPRPEVRCGQAANPHT